MDFTGAAVELTPKDYQAIADSYDHELAEVLAVVEVEAGSTGFDAKGRPIILPEPHIFYKELGKVSTAKRDRAVALGLAYKKWKTKPYPRTSDERYRNLEAMMAIDETAALKSVSWGLGQVMGFNYEAAGFPDVQTMVRAFTQSELNQLRGMFSFIATNGLDDELRRDDYEGFTRGYNGTGQVAKYAARLRAAVAKYRQQGGTATGQPTLPLLKKGSKGAAVTEAQKLLVRAGYYRAEDIDGDFGDLTESAVRRFQEEHSETGLVDGRIGKKTWAALNAEDGVVVEDVVPPAPQSRPEPTSNPLGPIVGGGILAGGGAQTAAEAGVDPTYIWMGVGVIALLVIAYFIFRRRN